MEGRVDGWHGIRGGMEDASQPGSTVSGLFSRKYGDAASHVEVTDGRVCTKVKNRLLLLV